MPTLPPLKIPSKIVPISNLQNISYNGKFLKSAYNNTIYYTDVTSGRVVGKMKYMRNVCCFFENLVGLEDGTLVVEPAHSLETINFNLLYNFLDNVNSNNINSNNIDNSNNIHNTYGIQNSDSVSIKVHKSPITKLSKYKSLIVTTAGKTVKILKDKEIIKTFYLENFVTDFYFDGLMYLCDCQGNVYEFDIESLYKIVIHKSYISNDNNTSNNKLNDNKITNDNNKSGNKIINDNNKSDDNKINGNNKTNDSKTDITNISVKKIKSLNHRINKIIHTGSLYSFGEKIINEKTEKKIESDDVVFHNDHFYIISPCNCLSRNNCIVTSENSNNNDNSNDSSENPNDSIDNSKIESNNLNDNSIFKNDNSKTKNDNSKTENNNFSHILILNKNLEITKTIHLTVNLTLKKITITNSYIILVSDEYEIIFCDFEFNIKFTLIGNNDEIVDMEYVDGMLFVGSNSGRLRYMDVCDIVQSICRFSDNCDSDANIIIDEKTNIIIDDRYNITIDDTMSKNAEHYIQNNVKLNNVIQNNIKQNNDIQNNNMKSYEYAFKGTLLNAHSDSIMAIKSFKNQILTCSRDKKLILWQVVRKNGMKIIKIKEFMNHLESVNSCFINEDYFGSVSKDQSLIVYKNKFNGDYSDFLKFNSKCNSVDNWNIKKDLNDNCKSKKDLNENCNSKKDLNDNCNIKEDDTPIFTKIMHSKEINHCLIHNNKIYTASTDKTIKITDMKNETTLKGNSAVLQIDIYGNFLVSASKNQIRVWDLGSKECIRVLECDYEILSVKFGSSYSDNNFTFKNNLVKNNNLTANNNNLVKNSNLGTNGSESKKKCYVFYGGNDGTLGIFDFLRNKKYEMRGVLGGFLWSICKIGDFFIQDSEYNSNSTVFDDYTKNKNETGNLLAHNNEKNISKGIVGNIDNEKTKNDEEINNNGGINRNEMTNKNEKINNNEKIIKNGIIYEKESNNNVVKNNNEEPTDKETVDNLSNQYRAKEIFVTGCDGIIAFFYHQIDEIKKNKLETEKIKKENKFLVEKFKVEGKFMDALKILLLGEEIDEIFVLLLKVDMNDFFEFYDKLDGVNISNLVDNKNSEILNNDNLCITESHNLNMKNVDSMLNTKNENLLKNKNLENTSSGLNKKVIENKIMRIIQKFGKSLKYAETVNNLIIQGRKRNWGMDDKIIGNLKRNFRGVENMRREMCSFELLFKDLIKKI